MPGIYLKSISPNIIEIKLRGFHGKYLIRGSSIGITKEFPFTAIKT